MDNIDLLKNKIKTVKIGFNLIGFISLVIGLLMPLFLLIDNVPAAVIGTLLGLAVSVNTFRAKSYYIESLEKLSGGNEVVRIEF